MYITSRDCDLTGETYNGDGVWYSSDYGVHWTNVASGYGEIRSVACNSTGNFLAMLAVSLSDEKARVYTSSDYGDTFEEKLVGSVPTQMCRLCVNSTGDRITVGSATDVWTSADYGDTWNQHTPSVPLTNIVCNDTGDVLLGVNIGGPGHCYTSSDYGANWTEQVSSPSGTWQNLAINSDGSVMAATLYENGDKYIYVSQDYGVSWTKAVGAGSRDWSTDTTGLGVNSSGEKIFATSVSYASTPYDGFYNSKDYGANWIVTLLEKQFRCESLSTNDSGSKALMTSQKVDQSETYVYTGKE